MLQFNTVCTYNQPQLTLNSHYGSTVTVTELVALMTGDPPQGCVCCLGLIWSHGVPMVARSRVEAENRGVTQATIELYIMDSITSNRVASSLSITYIVV